MTEADSIAYTAPEEDVARLQILRDVDIYVQKTFPHLDRVMRDLVIAGLQERLLCSHWSDT